MSDEARNVNYPILRGLIAAGETNGNPFTYIAGETRDLMIERDALTAERDRYRAALAHYADEATWMDRGDHDKYADPTKPGWLRAHEALRPATSEAVRDA